MEDEKRKIVITPHGSEKRRNIMIHDDEILITDILGFMWRKKLIILFTMLFAIIVFWVHAFFLPERYVARVKITPVILSTQTVMYDGLWPTSNQLFKLFVETARDPKVQKDFWGEQNETKVLDLPIKFLNKDKVLFLTGDDPDVINSLLKKYISYVNSSLQQTVLEHFKFALAEKKQALEAKIRLHRAIEIKKLERKILLLAEQKLIAERLNIIGVSDSIQGDVLYLRGANALQAEIDVLQMRKEDDFFISGIIPLQEELRNIEKIDSNNMKVQSIHPQTVLTEKEQQSSKTIIVSFGALLGFMLGIIFAYFYDFIAKLRSKV